MILLDANLLLYAYDSAAPEHEKPRLWLEAVVGRAEPILLPWQTLHAFLRISTNPRAWKAPLSMKEAGAIVEKWLSLPNVATPSPGEQHWEILRSLLADGQCRGPLVSDAVLAALAIEHGAELYTNDADFRRFRRLKVVNPLEESGS
jgi:toxin-antitoxin system PIN domain toxin